MPPLQTVLWSPHENDVFMAGADAVRLYRVAACAVTTTTAAATTAMNVHSAAGNTARTLSAAGGTLGAAGAFTSAGAFGPRMHSQNVNSWEQQQQHPSALSPSFQLLDVVSMGAQAKVSRLAWSRDARDPRLFGAGMITGRLVLLRFRDAQQRVVKEFVPRYARTCNVIAWNPYFTNQIAVGLERVRNGAGVLLWDVAARTSSSSASTAATAAANNASGPLFAPPSRLRNASQSINIGIDRSASESVSDPLARAGQTEAAVSLHWLPNDPFLLAMGTGFKWLRIYDMRDPSRPLSVVAHPKSVYGTEFDPLRPHHCATFSEDGVVKVWDIRRLRDGVPVLTLPIPGPPPSTSGNAVSRMTTRMRSTKTLHIHQVAWCPTRPSLLVSSSMHEAFLRFWDLSGSLAAESTKQEQQTTGKVGSGSTNMVTSAAAAAAATASTEKSASAASAGTAAAGGGTTNLHSPNRILSTNGVSATDVTNLTAKNTPCRKLRSPDSSTVASFCWHPAWKQRILFVTVGGVIENVAVHHSFPVTFNPSGKYTFAIDDHVYMGEEMGRAKRDDIMEVMRLRVREGYGLNPSRNVGIVSRLGQLDLKRVWMWIYNCNTAITDGVQGHETKEAAVAHKKSATAMAIPGKGSSRRAVAAHASRAATTAASQRESERAKCFAGIRALLFGSQTVRELVTATMSGGHAPGPATLPDVAKKAAPRADAPISPPTAKTVNPLSVFRVFVSPLRRQALRMCGWWNVVERVAGVTTSSSTERITDPDMINFENALRSLEEQGKYEKATALSILHLDFQRALLALSRGISRSNESSEMNRGLGLIALGLSGYGTSKTERMRWSHTFRSALNLNLKERPYIRAAFAFLSSTGLDQATCTTYRAVLNDTEALQLRHRIAFACRFLPEKELWKYFQSCSSTALAEGDLDGLLLTGLGRDGADILQAYLDRTGDIQTVSHISSFALSVDFSAYKQHQAGAAVLKEDRRFAQWILEYQNILNRWRMWMERASLDVARSVMFSKSTSRAALQYRSVFAPQEAPTRGRSKRTTLSALAVASQYSPGKKGAGAGAGNVGDKAQLSSRRAAQQQLGARDPAPTAQQQQPVASTGGSGGEQGLSSATDLVPYLALKPQVYARCNYCSQALALHLMSVSKLRHGLARGISARKTQKITSRAHGCPNCKKALPRCCLCLVALDCALPMIGRAASSGRAPTMMGSAALRQSASTGGLQGGAAVLKARQGSDVKAVAAGHLCDGTAVNDELAANSAFDDSSMSNFGNWFTWCQACRHGGHASHMADWFEEHTRCPVTGCGCPCMEMD